MKCCVGAADALFVSAQLYEMRCMCSGFSVVEGSVA